jgi:hypothetical protein
MNTITLTVTGWRQADILFNAAHNINEVCGRVDADSTSGCVSEVLSQALPTGTDTGTTGEIKMTFNLSDAAIINMGEAINHLLSQHYVYRYTANLASVADEWWSAVADAEMDDEGWNEYMGDAQ